MRNIRVKKRLVIILFFLSLINLTNAIGQYDSFYQKALIGNYIYGPMVLLGATGAMYKFNKTFKSKVDNFFGKLKYILSSKNAFIKSGIAGSAIGVALLVNNQKAKAKDKVSNPVVNGISSYVVINDVKIECTQGDIVSQNTEAIVNAANKNLQNGGGVCGAIFKKAGISELQQACDDIIQAQKNLNSPCATGEAYLTSGFKLSNNSTKVLIHAIAPDCRIVKNDQDRIRLLKNAYRNSLSLADANNIATISFPLLAAGIYACPIDIAIRAALDEATIYARNNSLHKVKKINFVLYSLQDLRLFKDFMVNYFAIGVKI